MQRHIAFWFLIAALCFFGAPLVRSGPGMEGYVRSELQETRSAMGDVLGNRVVSFADAIFHATPLAAATTQLARARHTPQDQRLSATVAGPGGELLSKLFNSYLQGLILQTYVLAIRLAIVLFWVAALAPLLAAAVYDGRMQRAVKHAEFGSLRPATFTLAGMVVIPVLALPLVYLTLPFHLSPLLAPLWAALVVVPLSVLVAHSQPLFGR